MSKSLSPHVAPNALLCTKVSWACRGDRSTGTIFKVVISHSIWGLEFFDAFQDCKPQKETSHKSGCSSNGVVRILLLSLAKPQILPLWALWGQQTARSKNNKLTNPIQESATTNQFRASMQTKPRFEVYLHTCQTEREKLDVLNRDAPHTTYYACAYVTTCNIYGVCTDLWT